jgi:hypothetical protein
MDEKLRNSTSLNSFYKNLFTLWKGLDYVGISNEYLSFRYMDNTCFINKEKRTIEIDSINNKPICIKKKYLKSDYVKSFFLERNFSLEYNKISWFYNSSVQETLINKNNNILIDLYDFDFIKNLSLDEIGLGDIKDKSILLLNDKIDKDELKAKIYNISNNRYNLKKFIKALYRYRENKLILNKCIENYNNVDIINNIYNKWSLMDRIKK